MNRLKAVPLALAVSVLVTPPASAADKTDVEAVVRTAYIEGVHLERSGEKMRSGFHESFKMFVARDGELRQVSLDDWVERIEAWRREEPDPGFETSWRLTSVDATGDVAVARVEILRDGELAFTDYLSLYRFTGGWKIVAKVFEDHR